MTVPLKLLLYQETNSLSRIKFIKTFHDMIQKVVGNIAQKTESQNGHFIPLDKHSAYQRVRNVRFSGNLAWFVFL